MRINKTDISKFSWPEAMSDSNGKTSGIRFNCHIVIVTCSLCLLITVLRNTADTLALAGVLAGLISTAFWALGYSKKKDTNDTTNTEVGDEKEN